MNKNTSPSTTDSTALCQALPFQHLIEGISNDDEDVVDPPVGSFGFISPQKFALNIILEDGNTSAGATPVDPWGNQHAELEAEVPVDPWGNQHAELEAEVPLDSQFPDDPMDAAPEDYDGEFTEDPMEHPNQELRDGDFSDAPMGAAQEVFDGDFPQDPMEDPNQEVCDAEVEVPDVPMEDPYQKVSDGDDGTYPEEQQCAETEFPGGDQYGESPEDKEKRLKALRTAAVL